jgi:hypothetical protein
VLLVHGKALWLGVYAPAIRDVLNRRNGPRVGTATPHLQGLLDKQASNARRIVYVIDSPTASFVREAFRWASTST